MMSNVYATPLMFSCIGLEGAKAQKDSQQTQTEAKLKGIFLR